MDGDTRPGNSGFSSRPLPIIGVRRVIMQCRAHDDDDDRAAPAVAPGPEQGVFSGGPGIDGLVDSWPETLVPSASSLSTHEWTLVDSLDSRRGRFASGGCRPHPAPR